MDESPGNFAYRQKNVGTPPKKTDGKGPFEVQTLPTKMSERGKIICRTLKLPFNKGTSPRNFEASFRPTDIGQHRLICRGQSHVSSVGRTTKATHTPSCLGGRIHRFRTGPEVKGSLVQVSLCIAGLNTAPQPARNGIRRVKDQDRLGPLKAN